MLKVASTCLILGITFLSSLPEISSPIFAASSSVCSGIPGVENPVIPSSVYLGTPITIKVSFNKYYASGKSYYIHITDGGGFAGSGIDQVDSAGQAIKSPTQYTFVTTGGLSRMDKHDVYLIETGTTWHDYVPGSSAAQCNLGSITQVTFPIPSEFTQCSISMPDNIQVNTTQANSSLGSLHIPANNLGGVKWDYYFLVTQSSITTGVSDGNSDHYAVEYPGDQTLTGQALVSNKIDLGSTGNYTAAIKAVHTGGPGQDSYGYICSVHPFSITQDPTGSKTTSSGSNSGGSSNGGSTDTGPKSQSSGQFCNPDDGSILPPGQTGNGIMTAIGCVPITVSQLVPAILRVALLAAGGVALLLMAIGALGMILSNGSPEALKNARARFTSAVIGLVFIIFAVLLLKIIGADLLGISVF